MKEHPTHPPITYAILAFLEIWGPSSGYDLKRGFDHALIPFFGAVYSQIYNELNRLDELGWVEMAREQEGARPARKRYTITDNGRAALADWQTHQLEKPQLRDELLLRTMFGRFAPSGALPNSFRQAITEHEQRLAFAREEVRTHGNPLAANPATHKGPVPGHDPYFGLVVQFEQRFEEMYLQWLRETLTFLETHAQENQPNTDPPV